MPNLGPMEIAIIAVVVLVLFGGSKLAGLGKSTGRALREFKDETKSLRSDDEENDETKDDKAKSSDDVPGVTANREPEIVDAEVVESQPRAEA